MKIEKRKKNIQVAINNIYPEFTDVLEFGVFTGRSIKYIRENLSIDMFNVFGFDTFIGLPEHWDEANVERGAFDCDGTIPKIKEVFFYKGIFKETIPNYLRHASPIAFIHIDSDLPSSTRTILNLLNKYIVKNTVILFDDWKVKSKDNENLEFFNWQNKFKRKYIEIEPAIKEGEQKIIKITE